jgi:deoxyadenosine/deoxycytidine kinase
MFVVIAGNMGAGKTTLVRALESGHGYKPFLESVDDNPFLPLAYADRRRWGFALQIHYLVRRFEAHSEIDRRRSSELLVQDRSIYEGTEVFVETQHRLGLMTSEERATYLAVARTLVPRLQPPDRLVYLSRSLPSLRDLIARRGREYESRVDPTYLEALQESYEHWFESYALGPKLRIEAEGLSPEDIARLAAN